MLRLPAITTKSYDLMAQADVPPSVLFAKTEIDLWPYRSRTMALLRRYARASVEVGRLPSLLGREFFRSRVTSYSMRSFEDTMVFVTDMEHTLEKLDALDKKLVAMSALEEYTISEISRALGCSERTVDRLLHDAIDQLSRCLLVRGLLERLPEITAGRTFTTLPKVQ
jgi:RNA polymerase sigma factor (sigma-70 family)